MTPIKGFPRDDADGQNVHFKVLKIQMDTGIIINANVVASKSEYYGII